MAAVAPEGLGVTLKPFTRIVPSAAAATPAVGTTAGTDAAAVRGVVAIGAATGAAIGEAATGTAGAEAEAITVAGILEVAARVLEVVEVAGIGTDACAVAVAGATCGTVDADASAADGAT